jgi:hypothetical protein
MSRKSEAGQKGKKSRTDRKRPSRLQGPAWSDKNPRKRREAVRGRIYLPPPEEDLGGGDICSLEEKPSTEDNMPLVAHEVTVDPPKEEEFENYDPKRSLGPAAIAAALAVFGALSLLIADHGPWSKPYVESARAHAATETAVKADGALITLTRKPSLYSRIVQGLR